MSTEWIDVKFVAIYTGTAGLPTITIFKIEELYQTITRTRRKIKTLLAVVL